MPAGPLPALSAQSRRDGRNPIWTSRQGGEAVPAEPTSPLLLATHLGGVLDADDHDDPLVARLVPRVLLLAQVLLRHRVDERLVGVRVDPDDRAAELQIAVVVGRVDDRDGDPVVALEVLVLLAAGGLAEEQVLAVPAEPDGVRNTIGSSIVELPDCRSELRAVPNTIDRWCGSAGPTGTPR